MPNSVFVSRSNLKKDGPKEFDKLSTFGERVPSHLDKCLNDVMAIKLDIDQFCQKIDFSKKKHPVTKN
jgi:hypothetical protein